MARGRQAESPTDIPAKGWKDITLRVKSELADDHVGLIAAGVAFYALLAIFPALTALMALGGLVLEPSEVTAQLDQLTDVMPQEAEQIILDQAVAVAGSREGGLGLAFIVGLLLAIYSASKGMGSLMEGLNVAYDEEETRGFISKTLWTLGLTVFLILGLVLGLLATLALPAVLNLIALPDWLETGMGLARWMILALMTVFGLAVIYRYGPSRDDAEWKWLSPGAVAACLIWVIASVGFSIYVSNFGSYNETFGSMAGVIILLMWLWISAFIILMGAELNAEIEAQTAHDTTVGPDEPMGERDAEKADRLGPTQGRS
ncbi:YihY/virulence factor BrkB family protein [Paracoccus spongiarum]|uniref:YihY/virulence factor BrkB family protein n=1 Tax=Paracoccus spongiarum TaxID=3064387 RepID=A0ABT9JF04_9RHOB|nr:YihY/virulence factor BrkB family protein [Paracoccus sp. 2205BS29-5]MDP5308396.1 YihY/virulence factor BrkB family protein [Paracoccus sp. 2205BS29-5]